MSNSMFDVYGSPAYTPEEREDEGITSPDHVPADYYEPFSSPAYEPTAEELAAMTRYAGEPDHAPDHVPADYYEPFSSPFSSPAYEPIAEDFSSAVPAPAHYGSFSGPIPVTPAHTPAYMPIYTPTHASAHVHPYVVPAGSGT